MAQHMTESQAASFLASLRTGEAVVIDGKAGMTVQREYMRADGAFGSPSGGSVTVGYGPGRYCTTVSAPRMAAGFVTLERAAPHTDAAR